MTASRIFLIGYRGTGKTTVARLVAGRLGWDWVDADALLESRHGRTIRQIFADEGEAAFRDREADLLAELCQWPRHVIATGGGVILRAANRQRLRQAGTVVWLTADPETIWQRLQQDASTPQRRPDLTVGGLAEVEQLLAGRLPLYRDCAHGTVDTRQRTPEQVAEAVLAFLHKHGPAEPD
jgi:shikimate kinase